MRPRIGSKVSTPDGDAEYRGPIQPHGMILVRFPDSHRALYRVEDIIPILTWQEIERATLLAARVERLLNAPTVPREGD